MSLEGGLNNMGRKKQEKNTVEDIEKKVEEKQDTEVEAISETEDNENLEDLNELVKKVENFDSPKEILRIKDKKNRKEALKMYREIAYKRFLATGKIKKFLLDYYSNNDLDNKSIDEVLDILEEEVKDLYFNKKLLNKHIKPILENFESFREKMKGITKEEVEKILKNNNISVRLVGDLEQNPFYLKIKADFKDDFIQGLKLNGNPVMVLKDQEIEGKNVEKHEKEHILYELVNNEKIGTVKNNREDFLKLLQDEILAHISITDNGEFDLFDFKKNYQKLFDEYLKEGKYDGKTEEEEKQEIIELLDKVKDIPKKIQEKTGLTTEEVIGMLMKSDLNNWENILRKIEKYEGESSLTKAKEQLKDFQKDLKNKEDENIDNNEKENEEETENRNKKSKKRRRKRKEKYNDWEEWGGDGVRKMISDDTYNAIINGRVDDIDDKEVKSLFPQYLDINNIPNNLTKDQLNDLVDQAKEEKEIDILDAEGYLDKNELQNLSNEKRRRKIDNARIVKELEEYINKVDEEEREPTLVEKLKKKWNSFRQNPIKSIWSGIKKSWLGIKKSFVYLEHGIKYFSWFIQPAKQFGFSGELDLFSSIHKNVKEGIKKDHEYVDKKHEIQTKHKRIKKWLELEMKKIVLKKIIGPPKGASDKEKKEWKKKLAGELREWKKVYKYEVRGWKKYHDFPLVDQIFNWKGFDGKDYSKDNHYLRYKDKLTDDDIEELEDEVKSLENKV